MPPIALQSKVELSRLLGLPEYILDRYAHNSSLYYKTFYISKSSGKGRRKISAPSKELKGLQRWVGKYVLAELPVSDCAIGFRRGCSIVDNASEHVGQDFVLNIDIKDFFPSIKVQRVYGLLKYIGYPVEVSWYLSRLLTCDGAVPQGAPSSPMLTNIICRPLDNRLHGYCKKWGWSYTRYCDDIAISGQGALGYGLRHIQSIVNSEGFVLNPRKTRVIRRGGSQQVTGLVCNEQVSVPRSRRRIIRAMFHQAKLDPKGFAHRRSELEGHWAFLKMVDPSHGMLQEYREVLDSLQSY